MKILIGNTEDEKYKVTLVINGIKEKEYEFEISLSGFFILENAEDLPDDLKQSLIKKNTVAIMMPYLRSQISLLTAQPGTESVVLPVFNVNKMIKD